ncbi:thioredoxin [Nitzschia inconspicua]|uniref:Thioredoxin n=1 Tax=Nitzschia inconspicua TaxID=303405 RepID=A0A9K3L0R1_9STRA|nr:thioredoxin [Nitzschia inconspicua]
MMLLCCFFLISACFTQGVMAEVVSLTDSTFEHQTQASTGATTGSWLVMFSIPSCESCQSLKPVLEELSQDEALYERGIVFGSVDCTESIAVCQRFSVSKLPTVVYLHKKQLYTFETTPKEEFPTPLVDRLKNFVLQDFSSTEASSIPDPPSFMDAMMEPLNKLYEAGMASPLLGIAIAMMAAMLFMTVLVLVYVLVRGVTNGDATTETKSKQNKTKKN